MTNSLVTFAGKVNLPSVADLASSLRKLDTGTEGSVVYLKMDKSGAWIFGAEHTEAEADSLWAVNPMSFVHGFICWNEGKLHGEKLVSVTEPLPEVTEPSPSTSINGWERCVGLALKCLSGEDAGVEARYIVSSNGGKRAVQELALAIAEHINQDPTKPVPVVALSKSSYQHKKFGRVITPVFTVKNWMSLSAGTETETPKEEATAEPVRRRRRAV